MKTFSVFIFFKIYVCFKIVNKEMEDSCSNNCDIKDMEDRLERTHFQNQCFNIFKIDENIGFFKRSCKRKW